MGVVSKADEVLFDAINLQYVIQIERKMHGQTCGRWSTQYKNKCFMNVRLLKHCFRVTVSWKLKKFLKMSIFSFDAGLARLKWLPDSLENSRCQTNYIKVILNSLLQVLDVTDFCSIYRRLQMLPEIKTQGISTRGRRRPCSPRPSLVPKTRCSNSPNARRKCGGGRSCTNHKWILVCRSTSCNRYGRTFRTKSW